MACCRKVFVSYDHSDKHEADQFIELYSAIAGVFDHYALGVLGSNNLINSNNPEYVMSQIRQKYLRDTTVTIVLVGKCTHSRRYVDWELKSSLRQGERYTPNGVMGIMLPSCDTAAHLPPRLEDNWKFGHVNCYARYWPYPYSNEQLYDWIEDAYAARTSRAHLIKNSAEMMKYSAKCKVCNETH